MNVDDHAPADARPLPALYRLSLNCTFHFHTGAGRAKKHARVTLRQPVLVQVVPHTGLMLNLEKARYGPDATPGRLVTLATVCEATQSGRVDAFCESTWPYPVASVKELTEQLARCGWELDDVLGRKLTLELGLTR